MASLGSKPTTGILLLARRSFAAATHPHPKSASTGSTTVAPPTSNKSKHAEWAPIYALGGFIGIVGMFAMHTSYQQLLRSPSVQVTKKKREMVPEVDNPDAVLTSAEKFIDKSFLRKVAHIQEPRDIMPSDSTPTIYTRSRHIESLKTAGVQPSNSTSR